MWCQQLIGCLVWWCLLINHRRRTASACCFYCSSIHPATGGAITSSISWIREEWMSKSMWTLNVWFGHHTSQSMETVHILLYLSCRCLLIEQWLCFNAAIRYIHLLSKLFILSYINNMTIMFVGGAGEAGGWAVTSEMEMMKQVMFTPPHCWFTLRSYRNIRQDVSCRAPVQVSVQHHTNKQKTIRQELTKMKQEVLAWWEANDVSLS